MPRRLNIRKLAECYARSEPARYHVALPLIMMGALYWLSSLPGVPSELDPAAYAVFYWVPPTLQNALHVPAYALLAGAWRWALRAWSRSTTACALGALSIASVYGLLDEWHQSFVPGRFASLTDVTLNCIGAVAGVCLTTWASRHAARGSSLTVHD